MRSSFRCLIALLVVVAAVVVMVDAIGGEQLGVTRINNTIKETPFVNCAQDAIYIRFMTAYKFEGSVHVKAQPITEGIRCYELLVTANQIEVLIPHLDCNVQRTRSLNPAGLFIVAVMIISFHEKFVTEGDRTFEIKCFHMQSLAVGQKRVTVTNERLTPSLSIDPLPVCRYSVSRHANNHNSLVKFVAIGERVYHHWTCDDNDGGSSKLCLLVTNCFVTEQLTGKRHDLIDNDGCSKDTTVMKNIVYDDDLLAARQEVTVFGFADRPQVYFQCQLNLIERSEKDSSCPRPNCEENKRFRRDIQTLLRERETHVLDAASQRVNVLDLEDKLSDLPRNVCPDYSSSPLTKIERAVPPGSVCVSKASFGIVVTSTILVAICTLAVVVGNICRRTSLVSQQFDME